MPAIHPSAIIHPGAELAENVTIGPYSVIGGGVKVGAGTEIGAQSVIEGPTTIGKNCRIFPFASLGQIPQDLKFHGERSDLIIGDDNIFREFVTFHRGTSGGGGKTIVGDKNFFMAYTHVAHDCRIGSNVIMANAATLAGHVSVEDHVIVGAFSGIHQYCRIGKYGFIGGYSVITKDVLPYSKTVGNRARCYGPNSMGLRRQGFSKGDIDEIHQAFRLLLQSKHNTRQAVEAIEKELSASEHISYFVDFIRHSVRGIIK